MNKSILIISFALLTITTGAQTKTKWVKNTIQKTELNESFILKGLNNSKVISFNMDIQKEQYMKSLLSQSNHLTIKMINHIKETSIKDKIYFTDILSVNTKGDTLKNKEIYYTFKE